MNNDEIILKIIKKFNMVPLKNEGGYFTETYRSDEIINVKSLPLRYKSERCFSTSILYLITPDSYSLLHKILSDEIFHFYLGDPVKMLNLFEDGSSRIIKMGSNIFAGESVQYVVPKNTWQGAKLEKGGSFALIGTSVSPGFEFEDYVSAKPYKDELINRYPNLSSLINELI
jgi:hypothetical protein